MELFLCNYFDIIINYFEFGFLEILFQIMAQRNVLALENFLALKMKCRQMEEYLIKLYLGIIIG